MTRLVLLRHGLTDWNVEGRLQGHTDIPLSAAGRAAFHDCRLPARYNSLEWFTSPLRRARESAAALNLQAAVAPVLIEMNWGDYEGLTLAELRQRHGEAFAENEARGLDLQPPNGESPRQVQRRLQPWLQSLNRDSGAVTHKGVIRTILAMAFNWPMLGKPPVKLDWHCLHEFRINTEGQPELLAANIPLE
jgi:broad specificity phosphatase PhoE